MRRRLLAATGLIAALATLAGCGSGGKGFADEANGICSDFAESRSLGGKPSTPSEGVEMDREALALLRKAAGRLERLHPPPAAASDFRTGVRDLHELVRMTTWMISRPDYIQLATTLPTHPELTPEWARAWAERLKRLDADAASRFSRIGAPACGQAVS